MIYKWKLNEEKIDKFRNLFDNNEFSNKLLEAGSWYQICSAMDAIKVGIVIINQINLDKKDKHYALELIELFTAGQMIKEGIFRMFKALFNVDYSLKEDNSIFNMDDMTDDKVFNEYRALSFAHSVEFKAYNKMANGQKSYFSWLYWDRDCGDTKKIAIAYRYPDLTPIKINFDDVFNYAKKRYEYLDIIEKKIISTFNIQKQRA